MSKKALILFGLSALAVLVYFLSYIALSPWAAFFSFWAYLTCVVLFSAIATNKWHCFLFILPWLLVIPLSFQKGFFLFFIFALPSALFSWFVKKNFALRIKVDINECVRPSLSKFFIFASFMLAVFVGMNFSTDTAREFLLKYLPEEIEISGGKISPASLLPTDYLNEKLDLLLEKCQGDAYCEKIVSEEFNPELTEESLGTIDLSQKVNTKEYIDKFFTELPREAISAMAMALALMIFLILAPLSYAFAILFGFLISGVFSVLKMMRVFKLEVRKVDKEVLV